MRIFGNGRKTHVCAEQQPSDGFGVEDVRMGSSPRYQFYVLVDPAALHSVVHDAPVATRDRRYQERVGEAHQQDLDPPRGGPERTRPNRNFYESIEGVTERHVVWMECPYQNVMTEYYSGDEGLKGWRTEYCQPPQVVGPPYDE